MTGWFPTSLPDCYVPRRDASAAAVARSGSLFGPREVSGGSRALRAGGSRARSTPCRRAAECGGPKALLRAVAARRSPSRWIERRTRERTAGRVRHRPRDVPQYARCVDGIPKTKGTSRRTRGRRRHGRESRMARRISEKAACAVSGTLSDGVDQPQRRGRRHLFDPAVDRPIL